MFRRISYKLTLTNPLTNNQTTTTTTVKTKTTTTTTALRATIGEDQATKKGETTSKAEEETFTSSSIIVITTTPVTHDVTSSPTTPVTHDVTSSPTALDRVSFDFLEDTDTLESNDLETADTVLKFSPGSTSGLPESVGFSAESSNFYSGLVDFSTESADNSIESADFSTESANPTLTADLSTELADLPILSADFSAEAAYNSSNELDKFSTGLTDFYSGVSRRSDTGPKISEKEKSPEDIINMIVVVDLENMDNASNIPGNVSFFLFIKSVYTGCPNKHGNSVTNLISSFQIIL